MPYSYLEIKRVTTIQYIANRMDAEIRAAIDRKIAEHQSRDLSHMPPAREPAPRIRIDARVTVTQTGAYIRADQLTRAELDGIIAAFTIKWCDVYKREKKDIFADYIRTADRTYLHIPRFFTSVLDAPTTSNLIEPRRLGDIFDFVGKLADHQTRLVEYVLDMFADGFRFGQAGVIIKIDAGLGKTFVSIGIIARLRVKTLIVVHTELILLQWRRELKRSFPHIKIGYCYDTKKRDGDVVVAIINSIGKGEISMTFGAEVKQTNLDDYFGEFGLVVIDEVHLYTSTKRREFFNRCQSPYMIGLSATPDEGVKVFERILPWFCGQIVTIDDANITSVPSAAFTGRVHQICYSGPPAFTRRVTGSIGVDFNGVIKQYANDHYRNIMIVLEIQKLIHARHNVLVFVEYCEHVDTLYLLLRRILGQISIHRITTDEAAAESAADLPIRPSHAAESTADVKLVSLMGGASESEISNADTARVIITTYRYMSVGKSIPRLDALVMGTPRRNYMRQITGRIFRLGGDTSIERQIIDIVDKKTDLAGQWMTRMKYYQSCRYPIIRRNITWDDPSISAHISKARASPPVDRVIPSDGPSAHHPQ